MIKKAVFWVLVAFAAPVAASAPQSYPYLPNNNQWTGESVYEGATLILAYADGNARTFTPEQVTHFEMTASWMTGAGQAIAVLGTLDQTPKGGRCVLYLRKLTLVDMARGYANYWVQHPGEHAKSSLETLAHSMFQAPPCR